MSSSRCLLATFRRLSRSSLVSCMVRLGDDGDFAAGAVFGFDVGEALDGLRSEGAVGAKHDVGVGGDTHVAPRHAATKGSQLRAVVARIVAEAYVGAATPGTGGIEEADAVRADP